MAEDENKSQQEKSDEKRAKIKDYEELIDRLKEEREELKDEISKDYRQARNYVRSHPEEGVFAAFIGGIALGYVLGKLGRK